MFTDWGRKKLFLRRIYKYNETSKTRQQREPLRFGLFGSVLKGKKKGLQVTEHYSPSHLMELEWGAGGCKTMLVQSILL